MTLRVRKMFSGVMTSRVRMLLLIGGLVLVCDMGCDESG